MTTLYLIIGIIVVVGGTFGVMKLKVRSLQKDLKQSVEHLQSVRISRDKYATDMKTLRSNTDKAIGKYKENEITYSRKIDDLNKTISLSARYLVDAQKIDANTRKEIAKIDKLRASVPDLDIKELTYDEKNILDSAAARLAAFYNKL